jgi:hypothetical protein
MKAKTTYRKTLARSPLSNFTPVKSGCFEIVDSSISHLSANFLIHGSLPRDPQAQAARLCNQFINLNRGILGNLDVSAESVYDGNSVTLSLKAGTRVGAIPLISPTTGKPDYGLVIKPRFDWSGIGPMLVQMGWRVLPTLLKLPLLPSSERKVPPWVLSSIILFRIHALLKQLERRFEFTEANLLAPRGNINWPQYITSRITSADFLNIPCRFPDLRDDRELKSAIHFTLRKQLASLESQRVWGIVALQLINFCRSLLEQVRDTVPRQPNSVNIGTWYKGPLKTEVFRDGLQAIEWTVEDRGLAGLANFQGLPWAMSMEGFFEAWVETITMQLVKSIGGEVRVGRKRETIVPLIWQPPYLGSQKYLLPDLVFEYGDTTVILDAKYKGHWEELSHNQWVNLEEELRKWHRDDLLQVLAYSTLFTTKRVVGCLIYPCHKETWESLKHRERLWHYASLPAGKRRVELVLTVAPMGVGVEETAQTLATVLQRNNDF